MKINIANLLTNTTKHKDRTIVVKPITSPLLLVFCARIYARIGKAAKKVNK